MLRPITVRAPDHLGDGVLALPAVRALAELGPLRIEGPTWVPHLYRHLLPARPPGGPAELAVLLKPSFSAAWQARGHTRRIGLSTDLRRLLLTTAVRPGAGHRQADLDAVARAAGAAPQFFSCLKYGDLELPGVSRAGSAEQLVPRRDAGDALKMFLQIALGIFDYGDAVRVSEFILKNPPDKVTRSVQPAVEIQRGD